MKNHGVDISVNDQDFVIFMSLPFALSEVNSDRVIEYLQTRYCAHLMECSFIQQRRLMIKTKRVGRSLKEMEDYASRVKERFRR
jgi:hypothetical protein